MNHQSSLSFQQNDNSSTLSTEFNRILAVICWQNKWVQWLYQKEASRRHLDKPKNRSAAIITLFIIPFFPRSTTATSILTFKVTQKQLKKQIRRGKKSKIETESVSHPYWFRKILPNQNAPLLHNHLTILLYNLKKKPKLLYW